MARPLTQAANTPATDGDAANQAESYELSKRSISAKFAAIRSGKWRNKPATVPKVTILGR